jgi:thiamine-phosphate pyrophosphorylase
MLAPPHRMTAVQHKGAHLPIPDPPLLMVTDRRQAHRPLPEIVAAAVKAGCRWISVREKDLPADEQALLARSLIPVTRAQGAKLTVHGEASLAAAAGADGVHLPAGSDPAAARALLGAQKLIGLSIHTVTEAEGIDPACIDYVLAGPAFETASKPGYGPELGRKGLSAIARAARVPVLAIGGVNTARVAELMAAGAAGVGVMGSIMRAPDPARETSALISTLIGSLAIRGRDRC